MMKLKGLFPLSADPITYGHLASIRQAAEQCDELIVLVANNDTKQASYTFSLEERLQMTARAVQGSGLTQVRVEQTTGLMTDFFMREGCDVVFRGVRNQADEAAEREQAALYDHICPGIADAFVYLRAPAAEQQIASSWVKHFVRRHVDVSRFTPLFVKAALEQRLNQQTIIGITGEIAVGKSTVAAQLVAGLEAAGQSAHHIKLDELLHQLYAETSPGAQFVRDQIAQRFGADALQTDRLEVNRTVLAQRLFDERRPRADIDWIQDLVLPHIERLYRASLAGKTGIILVEWAQIVEMDKLSWVNNHVILVSSSDQQHFVNQRGLSADYLAGAKRLQLAVAEKQAAIAAAIERDQFGELMEYENNRDANPTDLVNIVKYLQTVPGDDYLE